MKQFNEAEKEYQPVEPGGTFLNRREERKFFYKAGMLTAADIADNYAFYIQSKDSGEYAIGNNIGVKIREAANGNTNNS